MHARLFGGTVKTVAHPDFDDLIIETTYGAIWSRPGLALADRMVCTLAALCAVQQLPQLRRYVRRGAQYRVAARGAVHDLRADRHLRGLRCNGGGDRVRQ